MHCRKLIFNVFLDSSLDQFNDEYCSFDAKVVIYSQNLSRFRPEKTRKRLCLCLTLFVYWNLYRSVRNPRYFSRTTLLLVLAQLPCVLVFFCLVELSFAVHRVVIKLHRFLETVVSMLSSPFLSTVKSFAITKWINKDLWKTAFIHCSFFHVKLLTHDIQLRYEILSCR